MTLPRNAADPRGEEAALLERLRTRDERAYEELVRNQGARLLAVVRSRGE